MIEDKARSIQKKLINKLHILGALYGQKEAIQLYIAEKKDEAKDSSFEQVIKEKLNERNPSRPFQNVPMGVCNVTIPVRYLLEEKANADGKVGLTMRGNKKDIVGFFNPIPP